MKFIRILSVFMLCAPAASAATWYDVFVKAAILNPDPYVMEPTIYTTKIYHAGGSVNLGASLPEIPYLRIVRLGDATRGEEMVGGKTYAVDEWRFAVYASKPGPMEIPGITFSGSLMEMGIGLPIAVERASNPVHFTVHSPPVSGADWFPAYDVTAKSGFDVKGDRVRAGEMIKQGVQVTATYVMAEMIPDLPVPEVPGARVYAFPAKKNNKSGPQGIVGEKTYTVSFVPEKTGKMTIPGIVLRWYDLNAGVEREIRTPDRTFTVLPAAKSGGGKAQGDLAGAPAARRAWMWLRDLTDWKAVLLILSCAGVLLFLAKSPLPGRISDARRRRGNLRDARAALLKSCDGGNAKTAAKSVTRYYARLWKRRHVNFDMIGEAHPEMKAPLDALAAAAYGKARARWNGSALKRAFVAAEDKKEAGRSELQALAPLYPF